ncbi:MAG: hypothetical protein J6Y94_06460 [Bacteriovoracaceae bacterium]|nr:hypothetical protein [Bacteriovoracaceae bacterium]
MQSSNGMALQIKAQSSKFVSVILAIIILALLALNYQIRSTLILPPIKISKQDSAVNLDSTMLRIFNLGQSRLLAGLLWAQTLIDSDLEHYKKNDLNSWMYLRFKTIVTLDPLFKEAYRYGGQYLSTIKDDILGAEEIYRRGLQYFPDDFYLNYYAAFNYFFELGDFEKAKECYARIYHHPKARKIIFFDTLDARIASNSGDLPPAFNVIKSLYDPAPPDSPLKDYYGEMLYSIKAEIDLNCLNGIDSDLLLKSASEDPKQITRKTKTKNKSIAHCARYDFEGKPYRLNTDGTYVAAKPWTPYRVNHTRKDDLKNDRKKEAKPPTVNAS